MFNFIHFYYKINIVLTKRATFLIIALRHKQNVLCCVMMTKNEECDEIYYFSE